MPNEPSVTSCFLNGYNKVGNLALLSQNSIGRGPHFALWNTLTGRVHKPQFQETTQPPDVTLQPHRGFQGRSCLTVRIQELASEAGQKQEAAHAGLYPEWPSSRPL